MEIVVSVIEFLMTVMSIWLMILLVWQLIVSFFGYRRKAKDYEDHDPQMRFLVLVPAHNEEAVIGDIINNLSHMDYPREMYDFYILADNCTDDTAGVARRMGANVRMADRMAIIEGVPQLSGAPVTATDLRAGAALVIAGLMAEGVTEIYEPEFIDRGYENFEAKLRALGATISREPVE